VRRLSKNYLSGIDSFISTTPTLVFSPHELQKWIRQEQSEGMLPKSWRTRDLVDALLEGSWLREISLTSDLYDPKIRFAANQATAFHLGLSLKRGAYLSHASAAYLNSLTAQEPLTIYVNKEQRPKIQSGVLSQETIDRAFARDPRDTKYRFWHMDSKPEAVQIVVINGKNTQNLGVKWIDHPRIGCVPATDMERTLIDLAVRPHYSGGLKSVLAAYVAAKGRADVNQLVHTLKLLNHAYPYHQSIGFLMARAGFEKDQCSELRKLGFQFRFHLAHGISQPLFDADWNLYYPRDL
jgi:hypothetical protein